MRDWGRDCYCHSGKDNSCGKRFGQQHGELPYGYDHKYVYSHFGYNLKATDLQAAIGCAQLEKLDGFIKRRRESWQYLRDALSMFDKYFILPNATQKSEPSWFGFLMTVKENVGFSRADMVTHLEEHNIQTRMLFAGNLIRHPCFDQLRAKGVDYRVIGNLKNTDDIMNNTFWIGVYPGLGKAQLDYMIQTISQFIQSIQ